MKRLMLLALPVLALAIASPALAGGTCEADAQTCLNHMAEYFEAKGWAGLELDQNEETGDLMVAKVVAASPAEDAGFQVGDVLMAVNGLAYGGDDDGALAEMQKRMTPGTEATYTVLRGESKKKIGVALASAPEEVVTQWVGHHMLHYHTDFGETHP